MKRRWARLRAAWLLAGWVGDGPGRWLWYWVLRMGQ